MAAEAKTYNAYGCVRLGEALIKEAARAYVVYHFTDGTRSYAHQHRQTTLSFITSGGVESTVAIFALSLDPELVVDKVQCQTDRYLSLGSYPKWPIW